MGSLYLWLFLALTKGGVGCEQLIHECPGFSCGGSVFLK